MERFRIFSGILIMGLLFSTIGYIFWHEEMRYWLPTPVPTNLMQVAMGDKISIAISSRANHEKPLFIHFYNFDCSCSKFNITEFQSMYYRFSDKVDFLAVIQSSEPDARLAQRFQELMGVTIPTKVDQEGKLAKALGVYSTPQAVIIASDSTVFYKGNYNASRYCTSKSTKFAEMALEDILEGKESPRFAEGFVDLPYGCLIPAYERNISVSINQ